MRIWRIVLTIGLITTTNNMEILISLLVICAVVAVLVWLINQISFGPAILKQILIAIVVIVAIMKIWPLLG